MNLSLKEISDPADCEALAPLAQRLVERSCEELRNDPAPEDCGLKLLQRVLQSPTGVILQTIGADGETVGLIVTGPLIDPLVGDETPMVLLLWTADAFRRRGMSKGMIQSAAEILAGRGLHSLAARAEHNDDALISMGERSGFIRLYEVLLREGPGR
ncbi:MAG: hypothetical protein OSB42_10915 [Planctomycetota bacterium]|nr:hypothetical protein [Planctomycetota bacterium]